MTDHADMTREQLVDLVDDLERQIENLEDDLEYAEADCPDCACDDFEPQCAEIWQAFYLGKSADAIERAKSLVCAVTGRYL